MILASAEVEAAIVIMEIPFAKYESLQNDFCIIDSAETETPWTAKLVASICQRRTGVGADGLIVLASAGDRGLRFRLYNADGSDAEWSGNGVRCAAAFVAERYGTDRVRFLCAAGPIDVSVVTTDAGCLSCMYERPVPAVSALQEPWTGQIPGGRGPFVVDAGNPHWVFLVDDFGFPWEVAGTDCQSANRATGGVNVGFVHVINRERIAMRVYERGVGPTPSSGSGALAAVAVCRDRKLVTDRVQVVSPGGTQTLEYRPESTSIRMTAAARCVFRGTWGG